MTLSRPSLALLAVAACATSAWAGRVDAVLPLGATTDAQVAQPGASATVGFLVTQGTGRQLTFQVKRAKGSTLEPSVALIAPDGTSFDIAAHGGSVSPSATAWKAKLSEVTQTGLWRIEVKGANGSSGKFTLSVKGKDTAKAAGSTAVPIGGTTDITLVAGDGVALTLTAKRASGSQVVPQVLILDPSGVPLGSGAPLVGSAKTGTLSVKSLPLPLFGKYTLRFGAATGAGGGLTYSVATAPAKPKGKVPVANPGAAFETEPTLVGHLDATASTAVAGAALTYRWAQVSGPPAQLTSPGSATPTFVAPASAASLAFQLSVSENGVVSRGATVPVQIARRPLADAGRSQSAAASSVVTLDGTGSLDRKGTGLKYVWRQLPGDATAVTLAAATTANPTFVAPAGAHEFRFGLVVDDGDARSFEDVVVVSTGNATRPVADAGREQFVRPMADVRLSGLASLPASGVPDAPIQWTQVSGPAVVLADATTPWPSFTAPAVGADFVFEMTVGGAVGLADRVAVHVRPSETNLAPPARGFAASVASPGSVPLSATGTTDPEGNAMSFRWAQVSGAPVPLAGSGTASANATIPAGSDQYVFAVQANDGLAYGAPDVVSVRNLGFSGRPVASAGANRTADPGVDVTLDGSASVRTDGNASPLTYAWTQVSGRDWFDVAARVATFDPASARPKFALPIDASSQCPTKVLVFQLVVGDGTKSSVPDLVAVTFTNVPVNGKPSVTAQASDPNPVAGQTVTLFGTVHDADGDPLTVRWKQTSGPAVQLLPDATALSPTFVAPDQGTMSFQIVGQDGFWDSAPANVSVTVDRKPVAAVAVTPLSGGIGTLVTMDGSGSSDPEGQPLTYTWTQTAGSPVSFTQGASSLQFAAPASTVTFRLVVSDGRQDSAAKTGSFVSTLPTPAPSSNASGGKAPYGASVTLSANPGVGGPFTFTWRQINPSGLDPSVSLSSASAQNPTFTVPLPTSAPFGAAPSATFGVVASDGVRTSAEGTVTVNFYVSFNATSLTSSTVYSIISTNCLSCHSGSSNTCPIFSGYEYGMGTASAFLTNSVGTNSCSSSKQRLPSSGTTGQSANSYLLDRLKASSAQAMPPYSPLGGTQIRLVQDWIDQGCQNN